MAQPAKGVTAAMHTGYGWATCKPHPVLTHQCLLEGGPLTEGSPDRHMQPRHPRLCRQLHPGVPDKPGAGRSSMGRVTTWGRHSQDVCAGRIRSKRAEQIACGLCPTASAHGMHHGVVSRKVRRLQGACRPTTAWHDPIKTSCWQPCAACQVAAWELTQPSSCEVLTCLAPAAPPAPTP